MGPEILNVREAVHRIGKVSTPMQQPSSDTESLSGCSRLGDLRHRTRKSEVLLFIYILPYLRFEEARKCEGILVQKEVQGHFYGVWV